MQLWVAMGVAGVVNEERLDREEQPDRFVEHFSSILKQIEDDLNRRRKITISAHLKKYLLNTYPLPV